MNELHEYLLQRHSQNRHVVVFVEEAQGMPVATLEEIRLLSNLETQQSKLLQIVLFGQPELDEMISSPKIRQLKERITYSFQLMPFETNDIHEYLNARLRACGYRAGELFEANAINAIERFSKGLVRRINILADKALLAAYAENSHAIKKDHVNTAARDSEFISQRRLGRGFPFLLTSTLVLAAIIVYALVTRFNFSSPGSRPAAGIVENKTNNGEVAAGERLMANEPGKIEGAGERPAPEETKTVSPNEDGNNVAESGISVTQAEEISDHAPEDETVAGHGEDITHGTTSEEQGRVQLKELLNRLHSGVYTNLTDSELDRLQRQLEAVPPEVALLSKSSPSGDSCRVCWAMIYRPL